MLTNVPSVLLYKEYKTNRMTIEIEEEWVSGEMVDCVSKDSFSLRKRNVLPKNAVSRE